MTDKEYIQKLLDSFMAAETTEEEEKILSDYFCTHKDIPAKWLNFSIMFRGLKQVGSKKKSFHKRTILKWAAAVAVVTLILGTGLLFMNREEIKESPIKADVTIPDKTAPQAVEQEEPPIIEYPAQTKKVSLTDTRKHRSEKTSKSTAHKAVEKKQKRNHRVADYSAGASTHNIILSDTTSLDIPLPTQNPIPAETPTRSLSEHREKMRNSIQSTFENPSIFIAQNSEEL